MPDARNSPPNPSALCARVTQLEALLTKIHNLSFRCGAGRSCFLGDTILDELDEALGISHPRIVDGGLS